MGCPFSLLAWSPYTYVFSIRPAQIIPLAFALPLIRLPFIDIIFIKTSLASRFFCPLLFIEVENFIPANPLVTPVHIVPEWYFLFAYSILRTITSKVGGVFAMLSSMLILFSLPLTHIQSMKGLAFYGPVKFLFWVFVSDFLLLTLSGTWPVVVPFIGVSCILTSVYFRFFFVLGPSRYFWDKLVL